MLHVTKMAATAAPEPPANVGEVLENTAEALGQWEADTFALGFWQTLLFAGVVALVTFIIIRLLQRFVKKKLTGNSIIFYRLIYVAIIVIAVVVVLMTITPLQQLGTAVLASSGIVAVVVGLAAQGTLGNLFSGISISMSKPFTVGEFIEILDTTPPVTGVVESIGLRHTTLRDPENKLIVVPNAVLDKETLRTTRYMQGARVCSFLYVSIAYGSNVAQATEILRTLIAQHPKVKDMRTFDQRQDDVPQVDVYITELGDSGVRLRASVWTKDTASGFSALSDLRGQTLHAFAEAGIEIPYPTRSVVLREEHCAGSTQE